MAAAPSLKLEFTGERVVPGEVDADLWNEHVSRYHFAATMASGKRVLDMGCGSGYGTEILAAVADAAIGCDIAEDAVQYATSKYSKSVYSVASATALPLPSNSIDLIVAFEVIEHLTDWPQLLSEAARVLTSDGLFVVSTPNKHCYAETRRDVGANPFHQHEFELEEFDYALRQHFPFVRILSQNHQESILFSGQEAGVGLGKSLVLEPTAPDNSHFFVAVCSQRSCQAPAFAYAPKATNLLREREQHIKILQTELDEVIADRSKLLKAHRKLNEELEESNGWAKRLDRELEDSRTEALSREADNNENLLDAARLRQQVVELQDQIQHVKRSFWLRLGFACDVGPWTEGCLHLKRVWRLVNVGRFNRYFLPAASFLLHVLQCCLSLIALAITGVVFLVEDLCFLWFGKRKFAEESRASQVAASIVITNWNGRALLENYLSSVIKATAGNKRNEIIVVDNASTDGSVDFLRTQFPRVRVIESSTNLGFAAGSNLGVKEAVNDVVVTLNNDMRVEPDFLAPLLQPFGDPFVFAVSSQIFLSNPNQRREETGLTEVWWQAGLLKVSHRIDPEIREPFPCAYAGGGSSAFDRKKFLELGGFDELFAPFYYEDTDLSFRAWKRGWKVLYQPRSVVHHCHRATVRKHFSDKFIQTVINRNAILYCWKNVHSWRMLWQHLSVSFGTSCRQRKLTRDQYTTADILSAFARIGSAGKSRWRALSTAKLSDADTLNQPLGGYYRDRFIAPFSPPPARLSVLFASPYPVEPPIHGGGVFMKNTLTELSRSADVHLVSFLDNAFQLPAQVPLKQICKTTNFLVRGGIPKRSLTLSPLPVRQFASREFQWLIHRTMLLERIDVVQLEYTMLGQYVGDYRHIPCFLFEHDISSQTLWRQLKQKGNFTFEAVLEYLRMRRYEPRMLGQFSRVQVCSDDSATYLRRFATKVRKIDADVRAAVDTRQYSAKVARREPRTILFVGSFNHFPNREGLHWFITRVLDLVLAILPDVILEVVGSNPPIGEYVWKNHPSVRFTGAVPDVREPMRRASVFVCPILRGSGVRVKLLEAFASRIPVVSTTLGAEGLTSASADVCELADTPKAFAQSIVLLLRNQPRREELVERASLMVQQERDSRVACARLQDTYREELFSTRPLAITRSASA